MLAHADVAQLAERKLPKLEVAGSTPVVRFRSSHGIARDRRWLRPAVPNEEHRARGWGAAVTLNPHGRFSCDPGATFQSLNTGQTDTDTFTYPMADALRAESTAAVTITITATTDGP